jgi:hypothetical protein
MLVDDPVEEVLEIPGAAEPELVLALDPDVELAAVLEVAPESEPEGMEAEAELPRGRELRFAPQPVNRVSAAAVTSGKL